MGEHGTRTAPSCLVVHYSAKTKNSVNLLDT